jgi:hypothetical protein
LLTFTLVCVHTTAFEVPGNSEGRTIEIKPQEELGLLMDSVHLNGEGLIYLFIPEYTNSTEKTNTSGLGSTQCSPSDPSEDEIKCGQHVGCCKKCLKCLCPSKCRNCFCYGDGTYSCY